MDPKRRRYASQSVPKPIKVEKKLGNRREVQKAFIFFFKRHHPHPSFASSDPYSRPMPPRR